MARMASGIPIFPMSWKRAPSSSRLSVLRVQAERASDVEGHVRDPAGVRRRVLVVRLEGVRERLDRREERVLEALEAASVGDRELGLVGDAREQPHACARRRVDRPGRRRRRCSRSGPASSLRGAMATGASPSSELRPGSTVEIVRKGSRRRGARAPASCGKRSPAAALRHRRGRRGAQPEVLAGGVLQPHRGPRRAEQPRGQLDDALEHLVERLGGRELAAELEQRVGDLERFLGASPPRSAPPRRAARSRARPTRGRRAPRAGGRRPRRTGRRRAWR